MRFLAERAPEQEEAWRSTAAIWAWRFQIVDDVLDLTASEKVLGKPVASDLREGKATMAVLHALERCTPHERETIETVLTGTRFRRRYASRDYCDP